MHTPGVPPNPAPPAPPRQLAADTTPPACSDVWVAGRIYAHPAWEFLGVFTDRDLAIARCSLPIDFVGPARLNEALSDVQQTWPGIFFPVQHPNTKLTGGLPAKED